MSTIPTRAKSLRPRLLAVAVFGLAALSSGVTTGPALANSPGAQTNHYLQCLNLLLTDPVAHAQVCAGNPVVPPRDTLSSPGGAAFVPAKPKGDCPYEKPGHKPPHPDDCRDKGPKNGNGNGKNGNGPQAH